MVDNEWIVGYKVVRKKADGVYESCYSPCKQEYRVNEVTKRRKNNGWLCVFDNLNDVMYFLGDTREEHNSIFICKYKPAKLDSIHTKCRLFCFKNGEFKQQYWEPPGTIFAEEVMLIKLVF